MKPYGTIEHRKHRFGMLIPSLKNNLGADLLPGCQGTEDDCIAFVTQGEVFIFLPSDFSVYYTRRLQLLLFLKILHTGYRLEHSASK